MIECLFHRLILLCTLLTMQAASAASVESQCADAVSVKITISNSGVYRVPVGDLREVFGCNSLTADQLQLSNQGKSTLFSVLDETRSAPGDLLFLAHHLAGSNSYYNEFSEYNTYWLTIGDLPGARQPSPAQDSHNKQASVPHSWSHLEKDVLRVRFPSKTNVLQPEVWYWARLNSIDPEPLVIPLDIQQRRTDSLPGIRVGLRGWSKLPRKKFPDLADHQVEVYLNDHLIGSGEWRGQEEYSIEIPEIPVELLEVSGVNQLSLRVPERTPTPGEPPLVDAVLLNWVELDYRHNGILSVGQHYLRADHQDGGWFELSGAGEAPPDLMSEQGVLLNPYESYQRGSQHWHRYATLKDTSAYVAVVGDAYNLPIAMVADIPSDLRKTTQQADYLMLTHRRLREAIEPLADFHRQQGLSVQVVDIEDVYDEFSGGVLAPAAIRDFISHAYHNWQQPRPRFVLLVGDASWDVRSAIGVDRNYADWTFRKNEKRQFAKNSSSQYTDDLNNADRNLVPTWPVETYEGYAASDNVFVAVDGDDFLPDLAIGRFPVSDPADVTAIVNKTVTYQQQSEVGPWRHRVLWVTNEEPGMQRTSDRLNTDLVQSGFDGARIYPSKQEKDNIEHQSRLQSAFDEGQLLVHFMGHGGRYVWRTGPPDFRKNHDLFTLDHLEQLTPTNRLPFVMSMTCYSAPFDHPTADSIGEKFLRMPDRGAIGILAASWRNFPSASFSQVMLDELTLPGTMGEAVMRAKRNHNNRLMIETYNLLGDPAVRLALPAHEIALKTKQRRDFLEIKGRVVDTAFDGQVIVDWQDINGSVIDSRQMEMRRGKFKLKIERDEKREIATISVYAWNPEQGIDAKGGVVLKMPDLSNESSRRKRRSAVDQKNKQ